MMVRYLSWQLLGGGRNEHWGLGPNPVSPVSGHNLRYPVGQQAVMFWLAEVEVQSEVLEVAGGFLCLAS